MFDVQNFTINFEWPYQEPSYRRQALTQASSVTYSSLINHLLRPYQLLYCVSSDISSGIISLLHALSDFVLQQEAHV